MGSSPVLQGEGLVVGVCLLRDLGRFDWLGCCMEKWKIVNGKEGKKEKKVLP